ncbi:MAG: UDP-N-acetylmuramate dehydrogenase [Oscillospiraceae bacterium]
MRELTQLQQAIQAAFPQTQLRFEEPLARHTSFKIGGPCEVMAFPCGIQELSDLLRWAHSHEVQPAILGAGTNVLAADAGRRGLVICTRGCLDGMTQVDDTHIRVLAGVSMARAANFAAGLGLSGLEFAHGIPGSVGGGLYMNAGAYGGEMKQVAVRTEYLDAAGNLRCLDGAEQGFSYRRSAITGSTHVIVAGTFALTPDAESKIRETMQELMARRKASQPLELPSAGSTFKRPVGGYAAALIEQAGLKGVQIGGAAVSSKHTGFVVNLGGATEADVLALIAYIQKRVLETSGIALETEVIRL